MRLLPLVTRLRMVLNFAGPEPPRVINDRSPVYFSALTNVQELTIRTLDFRDFAPQMELYFGHFMPKLRSLTLNHPRGARRDLLSFIGLFPNLDNLKLTHDGTDEGVPGHSPVSQSAPPLQGCLTLKPVRDEGFLRDLSGLCGGLRFHSVDLAGEEGVRFLLDACAETLETLRVRLGYWTGMVFSKFLVLIHLIHQPTGNRKALRKNFDLSKCRSLRSLEITGENIARCSDRTPRFLGDLLSTITSSVFSEVVIVLEDGDIHDLRVFQCRLFSIARGMHEVKSFRLVISLEVWEGDRVCATEILKRHIDTEATKGGLDFLPCPPAIIFNTRAAQYQFA